MVIFNILDTSIKMVNIFIWFHGLKRDVLKVFQFALSKFSSKFGIQISLTIKLTGVNVALAKWIVRLQDDAVSWNLTSIL